MFSPELIALAKRIVPTAIYDKLDPFEASIRRFVRDAAAATPPEARVLDAGAGEGRFKSFFINTRYVGLDFAQGDPKWNYSKLDVIGRLEALPLADNTFDRVLCIVVLEHTPEPGKVLDEFYRVLKPGGIVHLVVPHMWEEHQRPHDYFRFTSSGIRYLLEGSGFRLKQIRPVGGFFWQLSRRFIGVLSFAQHGWRWILFPFLAPFFGLLLPLCCYYLDFIDHDRSYTLGFICEGWKE
jgi:SAM-dependent methyltransferase